MKSQTVHSSQERGFVIAVDALFALVIVFAMISIAFDTFSKDGSAIVQRQQLAQFAEYAGRSLEQSGIVPRAVIGNSSNELRSFLNGWPVSKCGSISIFSSPDTNVSLLTVSRAGCSFSQGDQEIIQRGIVVANPPDANLYVAQIAVWVNRS